MENLRGIGLMTASMAGFAFADSFIKLTAPAVPVGEILMIIGFGGTVIFAILAHLSGEAVFERDFFSPVVLIKNLGEIVGTFGFVTALALTPISTVSAILQATPLAVTLGAALFMQESVGWRRWSAIFVGLCGVLIILRPGLDGFVPASLFAVLAVVGLSIRDLATRAAPSSLSSIRLGTYGFFAIVPSGAVLLLINGSPVMPTTAHWANLSAAIILDVIGYYTLTLAMRMGDVSVITPFRYTRILFAIGVGVLVFDENIDTVTLIGIGIIIASGLYTFARENTLNAAK